MFLVAFNLPAIFFVAPSGKYDFPHTAITININSEKQINTNVSTCSFEGRITSDCRVWMDFREMSPLSLVTDLVVNMLCSRSFSHECLMRVCATLII